MKNIFRVLSVLALLAGRQALGDSAPAEVEALKQENAELRQRLEKVEGELGEIKQLLHQRASAPIPALTQEEVGKLKTLAAIKGQPVHSGLDLQLYGYIKLDAAFDSARTSSGDYARWVESEEGGRHSDLFNLTANQTRLGAILKGPSSPDLTTAGLVEIDFYGGGAENKPNPMLRQAYVTATWPQWHLTALAGQTADVISPLVTPTLNYTVGWWQGDIGYRRPQIRLTESLPVTDNLTVKLELAASRTIGCTNSWTGANYDTGQEVGFPTVQGRASVSLPLLTKKPTTVGVSGHWGQQEYNAHRKVDTWSLNVDLTLPVTTWLALQAEGFVGQNLDAYLGGVGQGVRVVSATDYRGIRARGGWAALTLTPDARWQFNVGAGCDDPNDDELATGGRTYNELVFGNAQYALNASLTLGAEISCLRTGYKAQAGGNSLREQLSVIYKF